MKMPPVVLGRYAVESLLGEGGMGKVYRGRHTEVDLPVAIKIILGDASAEARARFIREARLMARLRHPNLVAFHDFGTLPTGEPCIVMEFIDGTPLDDVVDQRGAMPWPEVVEIADQVAAGIGALHENGIIHRDLKDANVVMAKTRKGTSVAKVLDFGIAKSDQFEKLTKTGAVMGTPHYMAPEQIRGLTVDPRTDLFALGVMMYEMLAGAPPWIVDSQAAFFARAYKDAPPLTIPAHLPQPSDELVDVVEGLLCLDPDGRPPSADALRGAFMRIRARSSQTSAEMPPGVDAPPRPVRRGPEATAPTMVGVVTEVPWLVAARVPAHLLRKRELRTRLGTSLPAGARGYTLGAELWFATLPNATAKAHEGSVATIRDLLGQVFGPVQVADVSAGPDFRLPASALAGASPLPDELQRLVGRLMAA